MTENVELTDPRALRAYAHPTRLALLGLLRREGPKTATEAAPFVGESVASCSFHLRQLARYGLVEEVAGGHGRARPWRATARYTSWPSDSDDPAIAAAASRLDLVILDRYFREARDWINHREKETAAWRKAGSASDHLVHLTAAETRRLTERIEAIVEEFAPRQADPALRPRGSRPVRLVHLTFPAEATPAAGWSPPPETQPDRRDVPGADVVRANADADATASRELASPAGRRTGTAS